MPAPASTDEIRLRVAQLVAEIVGTPADEPVTEGLLVDLGVDSLSMIELVIGIEEEFGLVVPDADVARLDTFQSVVDWIAAQPA